MTERRGGSDEHEHGKGGSAGSSHQYGEADAESSATVDLSVVQADDALLDALGGPDPRVADSLGDQELNALLLAWRRDIDSEPMPDLVDTPTAVTEIRTAALAHRHAGQGRRRRFLVPVAAAAAVLAIGFTGTALAARDAQPGDTLWGLSKVLYADHARSIEAAASVRTAMQEAQLALAQQRYDDARRALAQAEEALRQVTATEEAARLKARHLQLMAELNRPTTPPAQSSSSATTTTPDSSTTSPLDTSPSDPQPAPGPGPGPEPTDPPPSGTPDDTSSDPTTPPTTTEPTPSSPSDDTTGNTGDSGTSSGSGGKSPAIIGDPSSGDVSGTSGTGSTTN
ncbi:anti-sigma-D factor RsdA [Prauserella oleivorans]|uniref:Anti-sigma-D factor RsdA n=1 Tax=Prauserella oleivorans TaxID=1478153 RepID=A0ABW5W3K7_9PSEU